MSCTLDFLFLLTTSALSSSSFSLPQEAPCAAGNAIPEAGGVPKSGSSVVEQFEKSEKKKKRSLSLSLSCLTTSGALSMLWKSASRELGFDEVSQMQGLPSTITLAE